MRKVEGGLRLTEERDTEWFDEVRIDGPVTLVKLADLERARPVLLLLRVEGGRDPLRPLPASLLTFDDWLDRRLRVDGDAGCCCTVP